MLTVLMSIQQAPSDLPVESLPQVPTSFQSIGFVPCPGFCTEHTLCTPELNIPVVPGNGMLPSEGLVLGDEGEHSSSELIFLCASSDTTKSLR